MKGRHQRLDRISGLPQDIIEKILTLVPIRDAVRTSILSRKWRYSWTTMPKLVFDVTLGDVSSRNIKHKFVSAILQVLLLHRAPILEFGLSVNRKFSEIDQIILHLSRTNNNNIKKFSLDIRDNIYSLPRSFLTLQGLEHLDLTRCEFEFPFMIKGFNMLKSLRLCEVNTSQGFLESCPLLEELTLIRVGHDLEFTEREFVSLCNSVPSVQLLHLSRFSIEHLDAGGGMPHKLPISLPNLRILDLSVCFLELSSVLCVISGSPNLEKIKIEMCREHDECSTKQTFNNLLDDEDYASGLNLDHLKEMVIKSFHNYAYEMKFVKLILANSPVLRSAWIELSPDVSVDEENKILLGWLNLSFPRASANVKRVWERV